MLRRFIITLPQVQTSKVFQADVSGLPTLSEIWDAQTADYTLVGSMGLALASAGGGLVGPGSIMVPITVEESGTPVSGVQCWITTDIAGDNTVAGTLLTDDFGKVLFMLDVGTYYLWRDHTDSLFP